MLAHRHDHCFAAEAHRRGLPLTPRPLHTRSLNAIPSTARAVAAVAAQRALDRTSVASVWAALGEDEQGEFVVKRLETARQHARARGPGREPEETNELERVTRAD